MNKPTLNFFPQHLKLRAIAEAAYLVSLKELNKKSLEKNYRQAISNNGYFNSLKRLGYEFFEAVDNKKNGFYALILKNYLEEIMVAIRGTCFFENLKAQSIFSDFYSDLQVVLGEIPAQYRSAEALLTDIIKTYVGDKIIVTGHSLGGLLAQLISAKFGMVAVAFESPGAKKLIVKLVGSNFDSQKITLINALPNFINTYGEHIKIPMVVNNGGTFAFDLVHNFLGTMPHRSGKRAKYLFSHGMEDILNSISADGAFTPIPLKTWPGSSMLFYRSMGAYSAMPEIYDQYIYQLWKKQYKHNALDNYAFQVPVMMYIKRYENYEASFNFRSKYPTFESYKSDFLKYGLLNNG